jgi:hypothetical protein
MGRTEPVGGSSQYCNEFLGPIQFLDVPEY